MEKQAVLTDLIRRNAHVTSFFSDSLTLIDHLSSHFQKHSWCDLEKQFKKKKKKKRTFGVDTHHDLLDVVCLSSSSVWFLLISALRYPTLPNLVKRLVLFLRVLNTSGAEGEKKPNI